MERIQKAIAKARASRSSAPTQIPSLLPQGIHPAASETFVKEAWTALKPYVPNEKDLKRKRIATLAGGQDAAPFDVMRTKVLQTMRSNNWRRLAITSPSPSCGKSTIALNLAFSLARQKELRTTVIELDLRRPSLAATLGAKPDTSITDVLTGQVDFDHQAVCYQGNLAFSLCTKSVRNPAELLHSSNIAIEISKIEKRYDPDLMIFDMPPMLVSDDMMAFAGQVDCVLLIAAAETTTIKEIDLCERELVQQANFMGVVLNKCNHMGKEYGYSYYQ